MNAPVPEEAFDRLARAVRQAEPPSTDHAVALLAVATGTITADQLEEAHAEQRRQREEGLEAEPLGRILLRHGYLNDAQYREILRIRANPLRPVTPPMPGSAFGRYRILSELGRGGMGVVLRALDPDLQREVAIKLLRFAGDSRMLQRLQREARATARLSHPNIVAVHEAGIVGDVPYLAMDLVEGDPLHRKAPALDLRARVRLLEKVARAIHHAHRQGVVHRDLKPGNIVVRPDGEPMVMDFGLAISLEEKGGLTDTGGIVGTPLYMAPEQIGGTREAVGPRTDVHALGVILYEMLAGRPPFQGATIAEVAMRISREDPVPAHRVSPGVPVELSAVALRALEKNPGRRYPTAEDFAEDLRRWSEGKRVAARAPGVLQRATRMVGRRLGLLLVVALSAMAPAGISGFLLPGWIRARREAAMERAEAVEREAALKELGTLLVKVVLARKDYYQAQADPARARRQLEEAVGDLDLLVARRPRRPEGYFVRARAKLALDDLRGAERDLGLAVGIEPAFSPGWALLGQTLIEHDRLRIHAGGEDRHAAIRLEDAAHALRQAAGAPDEVLAPARWGLFEVQEDRSLPVLLRALVARYVRRDAEEARQILQAAVRQTPSEEYYLWLAYGEEDPRHQVELYGRAIDVMPHCARAFLERGAARWRLGRIRDGLEDLGKALQINPKFVLGWLNQGALKLQGGDLEGARADLTRATELDPSEARARSLRGWVRYRSGDASGAIEDLSRAIALDPRNPVSWERRARARLRAGDVSEASRDAEVAVRLDPARAPSYHARGLVRREHGDLQGAIDDYTRAIGLAPDLGEAYADRGAAREEAGDRGGAAEDRQRSAELLPPR